MKRISRRQAILLAAAVPLVPMASGCRASLPPWSTADTSAQARAVVRDSALAHGLAAFSAIRDVNVSYAGNWRRLVAKLQPDLVDAGFRGGSQERMLLREGIMAQSHRGPQGMKQVVRRHGGEGQHGIEVWFNGAQTVDQSKLDAAALVSDAYALFLLGPLLLEVNQRPHREMQVAMAPAATLRQDTQSSLCDVVNLRLSPGLGNSASDQLALYIDRQSRLMRRVRMTLNGLQSTQGALVDIDTFEHRAVNGILWPTAFHERLLRPAPLDVHTWRLTGIDVNRGESPGDLSGPSFRGTAAAPAAALNG